MFVDGHGVESHPEVHREKQRKSGNVSRVKRALGSKLWVGKDYSNPIKRDFFDIPKPFEGEFCVWALFPLTPSLVLNKFFTQIQSTTSFVSIVLKDQHLN